MILFLFFCWPFSKPFLLSLLLLLFVLLFTRSYYYYYYIYIIFYILASCSLRMTENRLQSALARCDKCTNHAQLCAVTDEILRPIMEELLVTPLRKNVSDYISIDECCPSIVEVRKFFELDMNAADDVWFFLYQIGSRFLEKSTRKRTRDSENCKVGIIVTNVFVLFCNRGVPKLEELRLRWAFLKKEKAKFESSDTYVHANASERRRMHMHTVLAVFSERAHRHYFTALWLKCIDFAAEAALHAHLLYRLGTSILPSLTNPLVVADYLSGCFRSGGLISVLSLQGIFLLMLDHGLEYPQYYEQLYSLITADAFSSRHRYDLFKLLDLSMTSLRVPSYIAASVIKRTARVCLVAPSPTLYFALPFIRKVLQAHPNCLALIHRSSKEAVLDDDLEGDQIQFLNDKLKAAQHTANLFKGIDPFCPDSDPAVSNAICSTLWEFTALEKHFLPTVPLMISAFSSTAEDKSMLKFEKSYGRLFTAEVTRRLRSEDIPPLAYREPLEISQQSIINL